MMVVLDTLEILISSPVHSAEQESFKKFSSKLFIPLYFHLYEETIPDGTL